MSDERQQATWQIYLGMASKYPWYSDFTLSKEAHFTNLLEQAETAARIYMESIK